jgi:hypothetical protein
MHDLDGTTQSEALSEVVKLRRDQDKLIGVIGSLPAKDLLRAVKLIRENSERIRSIQERHFPVLVSYDDQAAEDPQPTDFEMAIERERDVLKEVIRILEGALEKTDEPRLYVPLATERKKMADCQQNAIRARTRMRIEIVRPSEQE